MLPQPRRPCMGGITLSLPYNARNVPNAHTLRQNATPQERHLWYDFLSSYPIRFQRQKPIDNYIVDFYCHKAKLVIEIDGSQHYTHTEITCDNVRTQQLQKYGITVIRVSNREINEDFQGVCQYIHRTVSSILGYEPQF